MKKQIIKEIICGCVVLMLLFCSFGCGKNEEEDSSGIIVERTFGSPIPSETPSPSPSEAEEPSPSASTSSITREEGAESIAYINGDAVNIREINSTTGKVLGQLPVGSVISVIKKSYGNGWSLIKYNDIEAFMATQYLTVLTSETSLPIECKATVNSEDVNMRAASTTDALIISTLSKGTEIEIIKRDVGHNWSMILYNGKVAFVASRYLDFEGGAPEPEPSSAPTPST